MMLFPSISRYFLTSLFAVVLVCVTQVMVPVPAQDAANPTTPQQGHVQLSPLNLDRNALPSYSVDSPNNIQTDDFDTVPYNNGAVELDLWKIENKKFVRSNAVISPDRQRMAYSEVIFMPHNRQTFSNLYLVPLPKKAKPAESQMLPEDYYQAQFEADQKRPSKWKFWKKWKRETGPTPGEIHRAAMYNPDNQISNRRMLLSVGRDKSASHLFETLTVVDWSASGRRLLFKRRSGVLYTGLKTSDILVFDSQQGTITVYPELHRIITHFWDRQGSLPPLSQLAWDIYPMGWEPHSDSSILFKVWAFDKKSRKFLGIWRYDVDSEQTKLVTLEDQALPIAANGVVAQPDVIYDPQSGLWIKKGK